MKRLIVLLLLPPLAWAGSASLQWDPPADTAGITGYQILYGTASGVYGSTPVSVVGATTKAATVNNLKAGVKYFFVARSTTADPTVFSANSNEVATTVPPGAPAGLTISVISN